METLTIDVPETKLPLVKLLFTEIGIVIHQNESKELRGEIKDTQASSSTKKPSDFFGMLSQEEGKKFDKHINQIRNEWDRNI